MSNMPNEFQAHSSAKNKPRIRYGCGAAPKSAMKSDDMEAPPRIELGNKGFADLCLTAWLWCHCFSDFSIIPEKAASVKTFLERSDFFPEKICFSCCVDIHMLCALLLSLFTKIGVDNAHFIMYNKSISFIHLRKTKCLPHQQRSFFALRIRRHQKGWEFFLRKQTFTNKIVRLAGRVLCTQLASILTYFVLVLVVMSFWDDPSKDMTPIYLLATAGSQISVLCLIYKPIWLLGEDHATDLRIGKTRRCPAAGLIIGLCGVSPAIIAWLANLILSFSHSSSSIADSVLGYMLYVWAPYFNMIPHGAWYSPLLFLPALVPVPILSHIAFYRGMRGLTLKKSIQEWKQRKTSTV